jgi:hypothetical protein
VTLLLVVLFFLDIAFGRLIEPYFGAFFALFRRARVFPRSGRLALTTKYYRQYWW